jgi:hypothetical protein
MTITISTTPKMMGHPFQGLAETTEGASPGAGSATAIPVKTLDIAIDGKWENVETLSNEDLTDMVRTDGVQGFKVSGPVNANVYAWIQWLLNAQSLVPSAGTIWEPKSCWTSIKLQGSSSPTYLGFHGVKPHSGSLKLPAGKLQQYDITCGCISMDDPTTSAPAGVTLTSTFPGAGYYRTGNSNAVFSWNSVAYKYRELTLNVNRNNDRVMVGGADVPFTDAPMGREITLQIKALWNDLTLYNDWKSQTRRAVSIGVESAKAITTNNGLLTKCGLPIDATSNEVQAQQWDIRMFDGTA